MCERVKLVVGYILFFCLDFEKSCFLVVGRRVNLNESVRGVSFSEGDSRQLRC